MRNLFLLSLLCAMSNLGRSQAGYILYVTSAPSGTCSAGSYQRVLIGAGTVYTCQSGTWSTIGGGAPSGTAGGSLTGTYPNPTIASIPSGATASTQTAGDSSTKVATTSFVASALAGVNPAVAVQAATTAAGNTSGFTYNNGVAGIGATFTGTANTAITIDGYTFTAVGQRLLVKNDTQSPSGAFNGVYYVTTLQALGIAPIFTRALDYDMPSDMNNTGAIPVVNGTVNGSTQWVQSSQVTTVGTDPVTFTQFSTKQLTGCTNTQAVSGMNCLEEHTASASASLAFTNCINNTSYDTFEVTFTGMVPATNGDLLALQFSANGGSSYSSASVYWWQSLALTSGGVGGNGSATANQAFMALDNASGNGTGVTTNGFIFLHNPASTNILYSEGSLVNASNTGQRLGWSFSGSYEPVTPAASNAFQVVFGTNGTTTHNITSGTVRCYGLTQ